jgi:non-canonical (house-cleaning) NTP pyrophosphatase/adenine/guanine phosphoribosyltransferase-like PRPP-binding protein
MLHTIPKMSAGTILVPATKSNLQLGRVSENVPLCPLPNKNGAFYYFKLNDYPHLVTEGARLIAERIKASGVRNPYFVTAEASTLALAHVLRDQYGIDGLTLYKAKQINDVDPLSIEYDTITAKEPKQLFLGKNKVSHLQNKNIFILDSVCTTGGTLSAIANLLLKAGVSNKNIVEAIVLFTEGAERNSININASMSLPIYHFSHLPIENKVMTPYHFFKAQAKPKFKIVLSSESEIKIRALTSAAKQYYKDYDVEIISVKTASGVSEQPFNDETALGVSNRLCAAEKLYPNADMYVAIENGLFDIDNRYFDKAVIKLKSKNGLHRLISSDAVEFPKQYVEEARQLGFDKTTVADCMFKAGLIKNPKDPHADLGEKISREKILEEVLLLNITAIHAQTYISNRVNC